MARSRKDCLDEIAERTGRSRENVEDALDEILNRAEDYERDGASPGDAYKRARDEMIDELNQRSALRRRAEIMDTRKEIARHRYYATVDQAIKQMSPKLALRAARYALEAKLVGVNLPFLKGRQSVDAQFVAMRRLWVGGFSDDIERGGLLKIFASRAIEDKWAAELFELNRGASGKPGLTKDPQALEIAKAIRKWQRTAIDTLNREGAWIRSYSGYITRTSHSADKIGAAGAEKWIGDTLPLLDLKRTFGSADRQAARDTLFKMYASMSLGDHYDYGKPVEEPLYPNTAKKASAERELHFADGKSWLAYNDKYGDHNATHTVVQTLATGARRAALMKEFGTKPREGYEADKEFLLAKLKRDAEDISRKIGAREQAFNSPAADDAARGKIAVEMAELRLQSAAADRRFNDFKSWQIKLDNRFAQIDGTSLKPVNRAGANTIANIMSVQRMAKLGNVAATHFASLPTKAAEAKFWGIPMSERYASLFRGLTQGAEGSAKRQALELTLVGAENRLGHIMNAYDVADAPAGALTKWESTFFKLTGVSSVIDNQRGDFEAMAAAHLGGKRGQSWADVGRLEQRVLRGFGITEPEWKALSGADWTEIDHPTTGEVKTYLFPSDAMKLSDDQVAAYLNEAKRAEFNGRVPDAADIAKGREDLALALATAYTDRGGYAIPMPSARIRAMLFGKHYEPGTSWNMAKKLLFQFKIWPADMITRAWEREIYGRIGDNKTERFAAIAEAAVGAIAFGTFAEAIRDLIKGQDPIARLRHEPFRAMLAGMQRSGFGSIVGDYLLGQFDRHGMSAAANLLGPTFGQVDNLMDLLHAGGETKNGMFSAGAMRQRGADAIQLVKTNTPFMNLWLTHTVTDTLIWNELQEWIRPGYLQRAEARQKELQGTSYLLAPSRVHRALHGR